MCQANRKQNCWKREKLCQRKEGTVGFFASVPRSVSPLNFYRVCCLLRRKLNEYRAKNRAKEFVNPATSIFFSLAILLVIQDGIEARQMTSVHFCGIQLDSTQFNSLWRFGGGAAEKIFEVNRKGSQNLQHFTVSAIIFPLI